MRNYLKKFWDTQADYFKEYYPEDNTSFWGLLLQLAGIVLALYALFSYLQQTA